MHTHTHTHTHKPVCSSRPPPPPPPCLPQAHVPGEQAAAAAAPPPRRQRRRRGRLGRRRGPAGQRPGRAGRRWRRWRQPGGRGWCWGWRARGAALAAVQPAAPHGAAALPDGQGQGGACALLACVGVLLGGGRRVRVARVRAATGPGPTRCLCVSLGLLGEPTHCPTLCQSRAHTRTHTHTHTTLHAARRPARSFSGATSLLPRAAWACWPSCGSPWTACWGAWTLPPH
jgi:hypothetical protein